MRASWAAASFSGVVTPLRDPDLVRGIASLGGGNPDDLWGSPTADRRTWKAHDTMSLAARLRGTRLFVSSGNGQAGPLDDPGAQDTTEAALIRQNVAFARRLGRHRDRDVEPNSAADHGVGSRRLRSLRKIA